MAHLRPIREPTCSTCGKKATQQVYGNRNDYYSDYCAKCAKVALAHLETEERSR